MKKLSTVLILFVLALAVSGCSYLPMLLGNSPGIVPSGKTTVKSLEVSRIHGIEMRTFGKVNLSQGDRESVTITGPDNIVPRVKVENRNGTLVLDMEKSVNPFSLTDSRHLTFDIEIKELDSILVSGLGYVDVPALVAKSLDVSMSGSGQITLNRVQTTDLDISISGLGRITVNGQTERATVGIPGNGDVMAGDLACKTAKVTISGLGSATVWASEQLTGNISGSGTLSYFGDPVVHSSATGLGRFRSLGSKQTA